MLDAAIYHSTRKMSFKYFITSHLDPIPGHTELPGEDADKDDKTLTYNCPRCFEKEKVDCPPRTPNQRTKHTLKVRCQNKADKFRMLKEKNMLKIELDLKHWKSELRRVIKFRMCRTGHTNWRSHMFGGGGSGACWCRGGWMIREVLLRYCGKRTCSTASNLFSLRLKA